MSVVMRGSTTFLGAGAVNVAFIANLPSTSYSITLGGNANETFWWSAKAVGGFTINSSNAVSVATVDWIVVVSL
jgi:hypothetical protein